MKLEENVHFKEKNILPLGRIEFPKYNINICFRINFFFTGKKTYLATLASDNVTFPGLFA